MVIPNSTSLTNIKNKAKTSIKNTPTHYKVHHAKKINDTYTATAHHIATRNNTTLVMPATIKTKSTPPTGKTTVYEAKKKKISANNVKRA